MKSQKLAIHCSETCSRCAANCASLDPTVVVFDLVTGDNTLPRQHKCKLRLSVQSPPATQSDLTLPLIQRACLGLVNACFIASALARRSE
jgi:hypothetical protein